MGVAWEIFTGGLASLAVVSLVVALLAVVYGASTKKWEGARRWGTATGVIWIALLFVMGVDTVIVSREGTSREEAEKSEMVAKPTPLRSEITMGGKFLTVRECSSFLKGIDSMSKSGSSDEEIAAWYQEKRGWSESEVAVEKELCAESLRVYELQALERHRQSTIYRSCQLTLADLQEKRGRGLNEQRIMELQMEEWGKTESEWRDEIAFCTVVLTAE